MTNDHKQLVPRQYMIPFVLVTALFFLWAIPHNLNDVLIAQFMKSFEITRLKASLIQSAFYMGYFIVSMPAAIIMQRKGYKFGLVMGLFLYVIGTLLFWPAAMVGQYGFFLLALFVIAAGLACLETGANPFIAQLGDSATSERRLNLAQAFNPLGAISGALIGTVFIFSGVELDRNQVGIMKAAGTYQAYLHHETLRVIRPYMVLACVVFLLAVPIIRTKFPQVAGEGAEETAPGRGLRELFRFPHYVTAVLAQFFYVGAQVGTWSYFIPYIHTYTHQPLKNAGYFLTGSLVAFCIGRFASTYAMKFVRPRVLMGIFAVINVGLAAIAVLLPGWIGLWAIFVTSFFMSLMFPTIFALGIKGLGPDTKIGGSLLIMAIIGGAAFTPIMGWAGSLAMAMLVPLCCYVFIAWYSFVGSRMRSAALEAAHLED